MLRARSFLASVYGLMPKSAHSRGFAAPSQKKRRRFIDSVFLSAQGGKGGDGCASFRQERGSRRKFPDGGDGGNGGNIVFVASHGRKSLNFETINVKGGAADNGGPDKRIGRAGTTLRIPIPIGTMVREVTNVYEVFDEETESVRNVRETELRKDMNKDGMEFVAARGGMGGEGNCKFRTGETKAPRYSTLGTRGSKKSYQLVVKTIADVGLVGYPNAGKSSFLCEVSRASPKVASYPFTTLKPTVGMVEVGDAARTVLSVADIPGLVDGAHENRGLGHEFLGHIERTQVLLIVLDIAGTDMRDPLDDFMALRKELYLYDPELQHRPLVVFANKADKKPKTCQKNVERLFALPGLPMDLEVIMGSCKTGEGLSEVIDAVHKKIATSSLLLD